MLASALLFQNHAARPQTLAFPLAILGVSLLLDERQTRWRPVAWIALLAVWANLHGSFVVGLGLATCSALRPQRRIEALAAALGALCTPWGLELFVYVWQNSSRPATRGLNEWARPGLDAIGLRLWPALAVMTWLAWRNRAKWWEWLPVLGLGLLACTGLRHAAWVGVVGGPLAAGWLAADDAQGASVALRRLLVAVCLLVAAGLVRFLPWVAGPPVPERPGSAWLEGQAPVEAVEALGRRLEPTQVCVPFALGGLVRWHLGPGWTVPVDVRVWMADDESWDRYLAGRETPGECPLLIDRLREPGLELATRAWREAYSDDRWAVRVPRTHPSWRK
jgi:hypothetical protein